MSEQDKSPEKPGPATAERDGSDEPFLKRWSRLKSGEEADEPEAGSEGDGAVVGVDGAAEAEAPTIDPANLPDVESLDKDSDYTPFMQEGVPDELRNLALRKLFMSNPGLAVLDGLNDYDEDYSKLGIVAQTVKTAYKAGRGFLEDEDLVQIDGEEETEEIDDLDGDEGGDGDDGEAEAPAEIAEAETPAEASDELEAGAPAAKAEKDDKPVT